MNTSPLPDDFEIKPKYPSGFDLIQRGECPNGYTIPIACTFCMQGHMLECHYPMNCEEAQCSHLSRYY